MIRQATFRIASLLLGLAAALLIAEAGLAFFGIEYNGPDRSRYYTNERGYFDRTYPDERGKTVYWVEQEASPEGYRVSSRNEPAPAPSSGDAWSILLLGDSFTFGQGVKYQDIYSTRLKEQMERQGIQIEIRNCGIRGAGLESILETYRREAAKSRFDLVLYAFVLNDFPLPDWEQVRGDDFIDQDNNLSEEYDRWAAASRMVHFVHERIQRIVVTRRTIQQYLAAYRGEEAEYSFRRFQELNQRVTENGQQLAVMIFPLLYEFDRYPFREVHERLHAFLDRERIPYLDLLPAFAAHSDHELWVHSVDHHPNEIAHRITAQHLEEFLLRSGLPGHP
jgi:hypothetical protein